MKGHSLAYGSESVPRSVMNAQSRFPTSAHSNRIEFSRIAPHGGCWNKHKHRLSNLHGLSSVAFIASAAWPTTETSVECNATAPRWRRLLAEVCVCVCVIGFAWTWTLMWLIKHGFTLIYIANVSESPKFESVLLVALTKTTIVLNTILFGHYTSCERREVYWMY